MSHFLIDNEKKHCQIILFSLKIATERLISNTQVCFNFVKNDCTNDLLHTQRFLLARSGFIDFFNGARYTYKQAR